LIDALQISGIDVGVLKSGRDVLATGQLRRHWAILADDTLGDMSVLTLVHEVRRRTDIPIVVITESNAEGEDGPAHRGQEGGGGGITGRRAVGDIPGPHEDGVAGLGGRNPYAAEPEDGQSGGEARGAPASETVDLTHGASRFDDLRFAPFAQSDRSGELRLKLLCSSCRQPADAAQPANGPPVTE
jgi:CheY-like chemotaxis protein